MKKRTEGAAFLGKAKNVGIKRQWTAREGLWGYLFISPWLIGFLVFTAFPFLFSIAMSFSNFDLLNPPRFIGLENYRKLLFDDHRWRTSLWNTFYYSFFHVPGIQIVALVLAIVLNQKLRGISVFRTIFYLPAVTAGVATSFLWAYVFTKNGILNSVLRWFGIQGPNWLMDLDLAMPALIIMSLWGPGQAMIIYLAGLQGVPTHLYEACEVDGGSTWQRFRSVTLPLISPSIFYNLVMGVIGSFRVFTSAYVMTGGGPADRTLFYLLYLYQMAFRNFHMGYACAMAWLLFAIIMFFTLVQLALAKRWVYYEGARGGGVV